MWKGATVAAVFFCLLPVRQTKSNKVQLEDIAKAAAAAEAHAAGPCQMPKLWEAWLCGLYRLPLVFKK